MDKITSSKKVLFTGDRNWSNIKLVEDVIDKLPKETLIIVGDCPTGLDFIVEYICIKRGLTYNKYEAYWLSQGNAAGPIRNKRMIDEGKPDLIIAFHDNIDGNNSNKGTKKSKGTKNTLILGKQAHIPCYLITTSGFIEY